MSVTIQGRGVGGATLSDLDGLLVNSENFNQVFVQRTDPIWIRATIKKLARSPAHVSTLVTMLVNFVVTERHPEWVRHSLLWLTYLQRYSTDMYTLPAVLRAYHRLSSFATQWKHAHSLFLKTSARSQAVHQWTRTAHTVPCHVYSGSKPGIPSTGYIYVDDSEEEFTVGPKKAARMTPTLPELARATSDMDGILSEDSEHDEAIEDLCISPHRHSSDDGVFDVDGTASTGVEEEWEEGEESDENVALGFVTDDEQESGTTSTLVKGHVVEDFLDEDPSTDGSDESSEHSEEDGEIGDADLRMFTQQYENSEGESSGDELPKKKSPQSSMLKKRNMKS